MCIVLRTTYLLIHITDVYIVIRITDLLLHIYYSIKTQQNWTRTRGFFFNDVPFKRLFHSYNSSAEASLLITHGLTTITYIHSISWVIFHPIKGNSLLQEALFNLFEMSEWLLFNTLLYHVADRFNFKKVTMRPVLYYID